MASFLFLSFPLTSAFTKRYENRLRRHLGLKNRLRFRSRGTCLKQASFWTCCCHFEVAGNRHRSRARGTFSTKVQTLHHTRARATFLKKSSPFSSPTNHFSHRLSPRRTLTRLEPQQQFARSRPRSRATGTFSWKACLEACISLNWTLDL